MTRIVKAEAALANDEATVPPASDAGPPPSKAAAGQLKRWRRIEGGVAELERWMGDLVARGLATLTDADVEGWAAVAARLVDAQAPGLASRVEAAAATFREGDDWPARLLGRLGTLALLAEAVRHRASLDAGTLGDLRAALGWPIDRDEVAATGERIDDAWSVVGITVTEDDRGLRERKTWLWGQRTGRRALVLDFVFGQRPFDVEWHVGTAFEGTVVHYPSAAPLRALAKRSEGAPAPAMRWPTSDPDAEASRLAAQLARQPWAASFPIVLSAATVFAHEGRWVARDAVQLWRLALAEADALALLAVSGGHPIDLWGAWDGLQVHPVTAWGGEGLWRSEREASS